jgi:membrane-bound serine protease (ClpP class)
MKLAVKFLLLIADEILIGGFIIFILYYFGVDEWVIGLLVVILIALVTFIAYIFLPHLKKPMTGSEGMIGLTGIVEEPLNLRGTVRIRGELWMAESISGTIKTGEKIIVERVQGLTLLVKKLHQ